MFVPLPLPVAYQPLEPVPPGDGLSGHQASKDISRNTLSISRNVTCYRGAKAANTRRQGKPILGSIVLDWVMIGLKS